MKKNELLSVFRSLQSSKGRTSLAVAVGVLAMLLLLLSELLPGGDTQKAAASTKQPPSASIRPSWSSNWKGLSVNCRERGAPRSWSP